MELNQIKKYILKNLYTGVIKTSLTLILSIVAIPLTIKNIGINTYGIISIVLVFSSVTGVVDLGLSKALITFGGNRQENSKEISSIYIINLSLFAIIFLSALMVYIFNINFMGKNLKVNIGTLRLINSIAILLLAFGVLNNLLRASLEANFKLQLVNWGFLIQSIIINLGWLLLSFIKANVIVFLLIPVVSSIVLIIYHLVLIPHIYRTLEKPDKNSLKNVFKITLKFFKVGSLNSIHLPILKYTIILFLGDGRVIGIFELSTKLAALANNIMAYISNPFFSIASKHKENNINFLWKTIKRVTKLLALVSVSGYIIFFSFNKFIIFYFFKEYTSEIFNVLNIILIGYLFVATSESMQKFFLGIEEIDLVAKIKFLSIAFNIATLIILYAFGFFNLFTITFSYSLSLMLFGCYWFTLLFRKNLSALTKQLTN